METTLQTQNHIQLTGPHEGQPSPGGESSGVVQPPPPGQNTIPIGARAYWLLMNGDITSIDQEISSNPNFRLSDLVWEHDNSTALHIAASVGEPELVEDIIKRDQRLLNRRNSEGDLPIHVAVRAGQKSVVEKLVELAGNYRFHIIMSENNEKNTALHIALENRLKDIAWLLFGKCKQTSYHLNAQGICPLYLAIKAGFWDLVSAMLVAKVKDQHLIEHTLRQTRSSVVHAAIMAGKQDKVAQVIIKFRDLAYAFDEYGRTACSYAAYVGFLDGVKYFLNEFPHEAFRENKDGSFPVHKACSGGNVEVVKEFLRHSSKIMWQENKKGQNILHVAAYSGKAAVVEYLLRQNELEKLINKKDKNGNTPLHLASMEKHAKVVYTLTRDPRIMLMHQNKQGLTALDLAEDYKDVPSLEERLTWLALIYANAPRSPPNVDMDLDNLASTESQQGNSTSVSSTRDEGSSLPKRQKYKDKLGTLLMVSTLIATVTFAAGFTIPGGYDSSDKRSPQEGLAILARRRAFQVFVLTDTFALYSSILAAVTLIWAHLDDQKLSLTSLDIAFPSLAVALTMMSVAFMTGLFVVLHGVCEWLAFVVFILGVAFLPLVLVVFVPLFFPSPSTRNRLVRGIFHVIFSVMLLVCEREGNSKNG